MTQHIGIVACSAEGAALCYRTICTEAPSDRPGEHMHPQVTMHTHPLGQYMQHIRTGEWPQVADLMMSSVRLLARAGADFAICPDNTIHEALPLFRNDSPIPWLHIAEVVGEEARRRGFTKLGILGTKYLMTGPVYPDALTPMEIACCIPDDADRQRIDDVIFGELVNGMTTEPSRLYFNEIVQKLKNEGCDAAVLGCTEIPLLVDPDDCPLPTLDSTRLLARAALKRAFSSTKQNT